MNKILEIAAQKTGIKKEVLEILSKPQRIVRVDFPVKMDSGKIKMFLGYRVQHSNLLGPYKGGIRFHPDCNLEEVSDLAFWMMIKCAVAGIPYGGAKGCVIVNTKELSKKELERLTRTYTCAIADIIGPNLDIPAPDVYTNSRVMSWIYDEYVKIQIKKAGGLACNALRSNASKKNTAKIKNESLAVVTGKPLNLGGSQGRDIATAFGGICVLEEILKLMKIEARGLKVAIQGFGNAGANVAILLAKKGFKIIAVGDSRSAILSKKEEGFDVRKLIKFKEKTGSVKGFSESENITQKDLVCSAECDILIPAAIGGLISEDDARNIKAKIILELANGPLQVGADEILQERKIMVLPDILANAGGVTVSYFEWLQNIKKQKWAKERVLGELEKTMRKATREIWKIGEKHKTDLRVSAYILAISRLAKKIKL